jgi:hypothetical protein
MVKASRPRRVRRPLAGGSSGCFRTSARGRDPGTALPSVSRSARGRPSCLPHGGSGVQNRWIRAPRRSMWSARVGRNPYQLGSELGSDAMHAYSRHMFCGCGCGRLTTIATKTDAKRGRVRGQPNRFLAGHGPRRPLAERFSTHVRVTDGCWEWTGPTDLKGYGRIKFRGQPRYVHRVAWELAHGPVAPHVLVRHLCGNHRCVRVDHLAARVSSLHERRTQVHD